VTGRVTSSRVGRTTGRDWEATADGMLARIEEAAATTAKRRPTPIFINLRPLLGFTGVPLSPSKMIRVAQRMSGIRAIYPAFIN